MSHAITGDRLPIRLTSSGWIRSYGARFAALEEEAQCNSAETRKWDILECRDSRGSKSGRALGTEQSMRESVENSTESIISAEMGLLLTEGL
jgi:hypothetical protein